MAGNRFLIKKAEVVCFLAYFRGTSSSPVRQGTSTSFRCFIFDDAEIFVDYVRPIVSAAFYFLGVTEPLQVLTWYHYCLTYDDTRAKISAYLDGHLLGVISRNISR